MPKKKEKENNNKKQIILIIVSIIALIGTILFIIMTVKGKKEPEEFKIDGIDIIKNKEIVKDTKVDSLDITDQILYNKDGISTFNGVINNNTNEDFYVKNLYVVFTTNKEEEKLLILTDTTIKANDIRIIDVSFDKDMLDITKIDYIIEK